MNLSDFLSDRPKKTLEKTSVIKETLDAGKVYISLITKKEKDFFKVYYRDGSVDKVFQMKKTAASIEYLKKYNKLARFSDKAAAALI